MDSVAAPSYANHIYIDKFESLYFSLFCAASKDFSDPLLPPVSIIHCSRQVLQATSCIGTELL